MHNSISDRATDAIAAGAVSSPFWLPSLQHASEAAALVVPILGAIWLIVQIAGYVWGKYRENRRP